MTHSHQISIALATYNGETYLNEQVRSFAAQTRLPDELVVTDDGSTDGTLDLLHAFADTAPFPVHIHRNPTNLGFRDNFLKAASLCRGEYVSFSDQDDVWLPTKIEKSLRRLEHDRSDLCIHTAVIGDADLRSVGSLHQDIVHDRVLGLLSHLPMPGRSYGFTMTFRRSLLDLIDPDLRPSQPQEAGKAVYHDLWVYLLASVFGRISEMVEPLAIYRQHAGMTSSGAQNAPSASRVVPLSQYAFRAAFAADWARSLEAATATLTGDRRLEAERGVQFCRTLAARIRGRIQLYEQRSRLGRAAAFGKLVGSGAYRASERGGLGHASAFKDLALGVLGLGHVGAVGSHAEPQISR